MSRENRKRLLQLVILLVGLAAIAFAVVKTVNDTQEHVMPSPASIT